MGRKDSLPFRNSTGFPEPVDLIHGAAHGSFGPLASPTHGASGCFNLIHGTCLMVMSLKYDRYLWHKLMVIVSICMLNWIYLKIIL